MKAGFHFVPVARWFLWKVRKLWTLRKKVVDPFFGSLVGVDGFAR
jgi:hypothetical protein